MSNKHLFYGIVFYESKCFRKNKPIKANILSEFQEMKTIFDHKMFSQS